MSDLHVPVVVTDGGPWAEHDQACAVCSIRHAILNLNVGVYEPCGTCGAQGWELHRRRRIGRFQLRQRRIVSSS